MEVLQFKRLRIARYCMSLKCINVLSLPSLLNRLENMLWQESTERQHSAISVLYIQESDDVFHGEPKPEILTQLQDLSMAWQFQPVHPTSSDA